MENTPGILPLRKSNYSVLKSQRIIPIIVRLAKEKMPVKAEVGRFFKLVS